MDPTQFKGSPSGTLIPTIQGQMAFMPSPLPPAIDLTAIIGRLSSALLTLGALNASARSLDNPYVVIRPLQRLEARLSSAMEGTYTTADALALAEADSGTDIDDDTREVRNYIRAFDYGRETLQELPVSNRLIKGIHAQLLSSLGKGRGGGSKRPGEYKDQQNFIGGRTRNIADARFVPPPPHETETAMSDLERYLNRDVDHVPALIDAALMHYQFETIHPFGDGNGRVGRILIPLYLIQRSVLESPILFVSPAVEGRKDEYVDRMLAVSREGLWSDWINFFLEVIEISARSTIETISRLEALRADFRDRIAKSGGSARYATVADALFASPVTTIPQVASLTGVSYPAAQNAVRRLVDLQILTEVDGTSQPKRYISWPVLDASERGTAP